MSDYKAQMASWRDAFLADVRDHEMTVLLDQGLYRHLRFGRPDSYCMSFNIITWPGYLAYSGDMGDFVFTRLPDMFEFFRGPIDSVSRDYWAEKCVAADKSDGIRRFSVELFQGAVKADYDDFVTNHNLSADEAADLWRDVEYEVLACCDTQHEAVESAMNLRWASDIYTKGIEVFPDFWDHQLEAFTPRFNWCCFALRWAVAKYDERLSAGVVTGNPVISRVAV